MDQRLRDMEQDVARHPGDVELVRRFEIAMVRAGLEHQLVHRYTRKYVRGDHPTFADEDSICRRCDRPLRVLYRREAVVDAIVAGECVAFDSDRIVGAMLSLARDPRITSAEEANAPCVLEQQRMCMPRPRPSRRS